jgi:hypothetical protein
MIDMSSVRLGEDEWDVLFRYVEEGHARQATANSPIVTPIEMMMKQF